jgi:hypothetical protein
MRVLGAVLIVAVLGGCTSVKLSQRDGCWVRQTKKLGSVKEDIGPCARPQPAWSDDRLTRLVQECVAEEAHRWQTLAIAAWGRNEALPAGPSEETVVERCTNHAAQSLVSENDTLKHELSDVSTERDALRARSEQAGKDLLATKEELTSRLLSTREEMFDQLMKAREQAADRALSMQAALTDRLVSTSDKVAERMMSTNERLADGMLSSGDKMADRFATAQGELSTRLFSSQDRLADALGAAASKPTPPAVATATATSEGRARNDVASDTANETSTAAPGAAPVSVVNAPTATAPGQPVAAPVCAAEPKAPERSLRARTPARRAKLAARPSCEPAAGAPAPVDAGALPRKPVTSAAAKQQVAEVPTAKPPHATAAVDAAP